MALVGTGMTRAQAQNFLERGRKPILEAAKSVRGEERAKARITETRARLARMHEQERIELDRIIQSGVLNQAAIREMARIGEMPIELAQRIAAIRYLDGRSKRH